MPKKIKYRQQPLNITELEAPLPAVEELLTAHDIARAELGARRGSKREAYRNGEAQRQNVIKPHQSRTNSLSKLSVAEQIHIVRDAAGFTPYSYSEASSAAGLLSDIGKVYSTTRTLREVQGRQRRASDTIIGPERTTLHLVRAYGGYAADARLTSTLVQRICDDLQVVNPGLKLDRLDYEMPPVFLLPLVRAATIRDAVSQAKLTENPFRNIGDALDYDYMADDFKGKLEEKTLAFSATTSVFEARELAASVIGEQQPRADFWDQRVNEAEKFPPVVDAVNLVRGVAARIY